MGYLSKLTRLPDNYVRHRGLFKAIYVLLELCCYFDGGWDLRRTGFNMGMKLYGESNSGFLVRLMVFKRNFTLFMRIAVLLAFVIMGFFLRWRDDLNPFLLIGIIGCGMAFYLWFWNRNKLESIDKSEAWIKEILADD